MRFAHARRLPWRSLTGWSRQPPLSRNSPLHAPELEVLLLPITSTIHLWIGIIPFVQGNRARPRDRRQHGTRALARIGGGKAITQPVQGAPRSELEERIREQGNVN